MNKKPIFIGIATAAVLGLTGWGYLLWNAYHKTPAAAPAVAVQAVTDIQNTVGSITQRVAQDVYPTVGGAAANPLEGVPDVNPYKDTNPFSGIKTNPFE